MATPRKRWFRVADKIGRKAWTNDELASLIRLMAYLNGRWAREGIPHEEAGYTEVAITDLMAITGKRRADIARKSAERWADIAEISVAHHGEVSRIIWHKFPEFQEYAPLSRASPVPSPRSATRDTRSASEESESPASPARPVERTDLIPWDKIQEAFALYGRPVRVLSTARQKVLLARAKETTPDSLVEAVHGYMALYAGKRSDRFDPLKHLTPETIYRASNFPKYVEAAERERANGRTPPFGRSASARDLYDRVIARKEARE